MLIRKRSIACPVFLKSTMWLKIVGFDVYIPLVTNLTNFLLLGQNENNNHAFLGAERLSTRRWRTTSMFVEDAADNPFHVTVEGSNLSPTWVRSEGNNQGGAGLGVSGDFNVLRLSYRPSRGRGGLVDGFIWQRRAPPPGSAAAESSNKSMPAQSHRPSCFAVCCKYHAPPDRKMLPIATPIPWTSIARPV